MLAEQALPNRGARREITAVWLFGQDCAKQHHAATIANVINAACALFTRRSARMTGVGKGQRVLIDAGYAGAARGTGVSNYARLLAQSVEAGGREVLWLTDQGGHGRDGLADEAEAADTPLATRGLRAQLDTLRRMAGGLLQAKASPREIIRSGAVIDRGELGERTRLASPDLFARAHYRHMLLRQFTDLSLTLPVDIVHLTAPLPLAPLTGRLVTTIHDLIPIRLPWTTPDNKQEMTARLRGCVRRSDLVTTVSEASRRDIVEILGADPARVAVTPLASLLPPFQPREPDGLARALERFGLTPEGYILFVGAIEPKKNLKRLIEGYLDAACDLPLVLAGAKAWMWEEEIGWIDAALGPAARKRIRLPGFVSAEDLAALHAGASFLAMPSLYEGFGLPALDAMRAGRAVLASATPSLEETCGAGAHYVDPFSRSDIASGIARLVSDADYRARVAEAGRTRAGDFTRERFAASVEAAYAKLS